MFFGDVIAFLTIFKSFVSLSGHFLFLTKSNRILCRKFYTIHMVAPTSEVRGAESSETSATSTVRMYTVSNVRRGFVFALNVLRNLYDSFQAVQGTRG